MACGTLEREWLGTEEGEFLQNKTLSALTSAWSKISGQSVSLEINPIRCEVAIQHTSGDNKQIHPARSVRTGASSPVQAVFTHQGR
jgi:hypothetical protein